MAYGLIEARVNKGVPGMMNLSAKYNKIPLDIPNQPPVSAKNIGYDTKKIWTEYQIINRLLYRSRNQHKASISLQHLKEVMPAKIVFVF